MRSLTLSGVLAVALFGVVLAGCGGSSSDTKANEAYADSVCTAVSSWEQSIKDIASDFSGGLSKAALQTKVDQAQSATTKLVNEIKAVPPPDTDEGQAAKQQLNQLTGDVETIVGAAKSGLAQLQDDASVTTITAAVAALAPQVQSLVSEARSAIGTLKDAGGSLGSAFKSTDSCKSLNPT